MAYRCIFSIVRERPTVLRPYLTVLAADPRDVVASAGGLIYDRVRQGWRVTIRLPPDADARPLRILGADIADDAPDVDRELRTALLTTAALYTGDRVIRAEVDGAVATRTTEVLVAGAVDEVAQSVSHHLSAAAIAFKGHALLAAGLTAEVAPIEVFGVKCARRSSAEAG
jgi:hypothetical protein